MGSVKFVLKVLGWLFLFLTAVLLAFRIAAYFRETGATQPPTTSFVATRYGKVAAQMSGPETGPRVVLLHGTAAWSGFWRDVSAQLAGKGWRVIAVDTPPFGFSDRDPEARYSRVQQAERLADILKVTGPATIVGHSFGAGAGVELALTSPDSVTGLILVDSALGTLDPMQGDGAAAKAMGFTPLAQAFTAASITNPPAAGPILRSFIHRKETAAPWLDTLAAPMTREGSTSAYAAWLPNLLSTTDGAKSRTRANLRAIKVSVAIIWGEADTVTPPAQGRELASLLRARSTIWLPNVGHIPHIEDPPAFLKALDASLAVVKGE
jgi:pimeloyl-ACP methyl ester carboxylesterase